MGPAPVSLAHDRQDAVAPQGFGDESVSEDDAENERWAAKERGVEPTTVRLETPSVSATDRKEPPKPAKL